MMIRNLSLAAAAALLLALAACGGDGDGASAPAASSPGTPTAPALSLAAQIGQKAFVDQTLSGGKNMSCASCHSPQYAYGPPNSLSVQLGSDPTKAGTRAVPSLRYKDATPPYADNAANPDGVTGAAAGGGFMWDGRAATLASQSMLPLLNPLEMNASSPAAVVAAVQAGSYADLFKQVYGADAFSNVDTAFADLGAAIQAYETEDRSFHPYSSKYDLALHNKIGGNLTAAELRGSQVFDGDANCSACHFAGPNFNGNVGLMTDFTYQAIGAPRNDSSIPGNPDPIPANADPTYFDMGLCGPIRTDHTPAQLGTPDPYCAKFKVPTLRNAATRSVFFHNGVFHSLNQVVHFYNTRDTNPEYWYPSTGGDASHPVQNPSYALFPTAASGATAQSFNDLPAAYQGNIDEELPMGQGQTDAGGTTAADGAKARPVHSTPQLTQRSPTVAATRLSVGLSSSLPNVGGATGTATRGASCGFGLSGSNPIRGLD